MSPLSLTWARALTALASAGAVVADVGIFNNVDDYAALANASGGFPSQTFRSSDIVAPVLQLNSLDLEGVDDAPYIFLGTVYGHGHGGPMILDARDLSLVYADQRYENTYSSSVQYMGDTPYLTFWEGFHSRGHANGWCLVYDQDYNLKWNVTAKDREGALADMHELTFTPDGNVIYTTYQNIPYNVSAVGGPEEGLLMDSGFQEVNPDTHEVIFDWYASDHFSILDSYARYGKGYGVSNSSGWDFAHVNSVQKTVDGNYLISSRHLSLLSLISGVDGTPIWVLGGHQNEFADLSAGMATNFAWQHDARFLNNQSHITMFDNHGEHTGHCEEGSCHTRGLHLEIDAEAMTARVIQEYYHPAHIDTGAMGGFQSLPSGNVMVGWGYNPSFVEYKQDGTPVLDAQRGIIGEGYLHDMFAYRVSKHHWKGSPSWQPDIAVDHPENTSKQGKVYVSWNGATEHATWVVFASDEPRDIDRLENIIAEAPRKGFETEIFLDGEHDFRYVAAAAIDASRKVLGSTHIIDMQTGSGFLMDSNISSVQPDEVVEEESAAPVVDPVDHVDPVTNEHPDENSAVHDDHHDIVEHPDNPHDNAAEDAVDVVTGEVVEDVGVDNKVDKEADTDSTAKLEPPADEISDDGATDGEVDDDDDNEDESESTITFGNIGIAGGSLFILAAVSASVVTYWRRRKQVEDEEAKGAYSKVEMTSASR